jgi:hypothetical protein
MIQAKRQLDDASDGWLAGMEWRPKPEGLE